MTYYHKWNRGHYISCLWNDTFITPARPGFLAPVAPVLWAKLTSTFKFLRIKSKRCSCNWKTVWGV